MIYLNPFVKIIFPLHSSLRQITHEYPSMAANQVQGCKREKKLKSKPRHIIQVIVPLDVHTAPVP